MIKGKVFFIGTGPGDPSLLTLKAKKCLEHADLLLYEPSIHPNLLYYGKEGAKCSLLPKTQVSLRKILLNQTKEGNSVALLLHGDGISNPLCQEGKTFLTLHRTPYEIVPGILEPAIDSIKKPLAGIRIFVLRSVDQSQNLMEDLTTLGADVIQCPMIEVIPITKILQTIKKSFLKDFTMLIFTSANGVRFFMETLLEKKMDARILSNKKIITIGPKTKESLKEYGIIADAMPEKFVAESILDQLNDEIRAVSYTHLTLPTIYSV